MVARGSVDLWSASLDNQRYWSPLDRSIPPHIWATIVDHHIAPLRDLQRLTGATFFPSARSGYRPREWERSKGRDGSSLHTYPMGSFGAVDLLMWDGTPVRHSLDLLVIYGPWRRICYYPAKGFVHVDYGSAVNGKQPRRQLYESVGASGVWSFRSFLAEPEV